MFHVRPDGGKKHYLNQERQAKVDSKFKSDLWNRIALLGHDKEVSYPRIILLFFFIRKYWQGLISIYGHNCLCWHRPHCTAEIVWFGVLGSEGINVRKKHLHVVQTTEFLRQVIPFKTLTQSLLLIESENEIQLIYCQEKKKGTISTLPKKALRKLFLNKLHIFNSHTIRNTSDEQADAYKY